MFLNKKRSVNWFIEKRQSRSTNGNHGEREEEEESITLNISSRAISDCCWRSNLPDREREEKIEGIGYIEQKQIVLMGIDKKKKKNKKKKRRKESEKKSQILDR